VSKLKKLITATLVISVLVTALIPSFSSAAKSDLDICIDLGMLKGGDDGITQDYLDSQPDRVQAALLFLRLKGLGEAAENYSGDLTKNFPDAGSHSWGKRIMAYLYANPQLGWTGDQNGNFMPNKKITAQEYYKILLTALGYTQITPDNPNGDFTWSDTFTFAKEKGLYAVANVTQFKIRNLVTATVEALKANIKKENTSDSDMTLIAKLVGEGRINPLVAEATGIYKLPVTRVPLELASAAAVSNTKVYAELSTAAKSFEGAEIFIEDTEGRFLPLVSATLSPDGKTLKLTTSPQTPGALYILTVDGITKEFVGMVPDNTKPALSAVLALTNRSVKVAFDNDDLDEDTALNISNYTINGLSVLDAAWGNDHSEVILTTSAQSTGVLYELKVSGITDLSGNVMDISSRKFAGRPADTIKPAVKTVSSSDGNKVVIAFAESEKLDIASATDLSNYEINKGLSIIGIELDPNSNKPGADPVVTLYTGPQTVGVLYTLTINNIRDEAGNVMDKTSRNFAGSAPDTSMLNLLSAVALTNTSVLLTFDDDVDLATGNNASNYSINDLAVYSAEVDGNTVLLKTSPQTVGKLYTVTVNNVKDDAGNGLDVKEKKFGGVPADTDKPRISSVTALDSYTVSVVFSEKVTRASAEILSNYYIDNLGYPTKATLESDGKTVTLKTAMQTSTLYTLRVSNISDLSGNIIEANSQKALSGIGNVLDLVKLEAVYPIDRHTIRLTFNKELGIAAAQDITNYVITSSDTSNDSSDIAGGANISTKNSGGGPVARRESSGKEVTITFSGNYSMNTGEVYTLEYKASNPGRYGTALDMNAKSLDFAGTNVEKADILVTGANVIDNKTIELLFSETLDGTPVPSAFAVFADESSIPAGTNSGGNMAVAATLNGNKVKLTLANPLENIKVYYVNMAAGHGLTDVSGLFGSKIKFDAAAGKYEMAFATGVLEDPVIKIVSAIMTDENTLVVEFNHDIDVLPSFNPQTDVTIKKNSTNVVDASEFSTYYEVDGKKLTIYFKNAGNDISVGDVLTVIFDANMNRIRYQNQTAVTLAATAENDRKAEFSFVNTVKEAPYLLYAEAVTDDMAGVAFSEGLNSLTANDIRLFSGSTEISPSDFTLALPFERGENVAIIQLLNGLKFTSGTTYTVVIKGTSTVTDAAGIVPVKKDDPYTPDVYENSIEFSGIAAP